MQLTNFKTGRIFNFDWSRDGKWLALARGSVTSDVVLISDLRSVQREVLQKVESRER